MEDQQKKWVYIGILCLVIAIAYWYFLYQDQKRQVDTLDKQVQDLRKKINEAKVQVERLDELKETYKELEAQWKEVLKYLPTQDEIEIVLRDIDDAMNDSNLENKSFTPGYLEEEDFYFKQAIALSLEGRFSDFLNFLDRLAKFDRIVHPTRIRANFNKTKSQELRDFILNIDLSVMAYIQREET